MQQLIQADGLFGPIKVVNDRGAQLLLVNNQIQGGAWLQPDVGFGHPGPVSSHEYAAGWLMAGLHHPEGRGLMVGLGSGCGAISLLYHWPMMQLRVLEIDPQVIDVAVSCFPGINHFCNTGQLEIVETDAAEYLQQEDQQWDFGLFDCYDGGADLLQESLEELTGCCDDVWVNVIDALDGPNIEGCIRRIRSGGGEVSEIFRTQPTHEDPFIERANWIVAAADLDWRAIDEFVPYPDLTGIQAFQARRAWNTTIRQTASGLIEW